MNLPLGAINTAVLICSSLTMVLAVHAAKIRPAQADRSIFLLLTLMLGFAFLGIKAVEYHEHWVKMEFPGPHFHFEGIRPAAHRDFLSLYFAMTGLHALHMIIGCGMVLFLMYYRLAWPLQRRSITTRSRSAASTGTSWISSGSAYSRCST